MGWVGVLVSLPSIFSRDEIILRDAKNKEAFEAELKEEFPSMRVKELRVVREATATSDGLYRAHLSPKPLMTRKASISGGDESRGSHEWVQNASRTRDGREQVIWARERERVYVTQQKGSDGELYEAVTFDGVTTRELGKGSRSEAMDFAMNHLEERA